MGLSDHNGASSLFITHKVFLMAFYHPIGYSSLMLYYFICVLIFHIAVHNCIIEKVKVKNHI